MILKLFILFLCSAKLFSKPLSGATQNDVNSLLEGLVPLDKRTDSFVTLDYQNMASKKNPSHDNAKNPLFELVDNKIYNDPVYTQIANLIPLFDHDSEHQLEISAAMESQISDLLDSLIKTDVVKYTWNFLISHGISSADEASFKKQLYNLWFTPYAREKVVGSCGFKSVFVGEYSGNLFTRFSNWFGFHIQEKKGDFNYHGWFAKANEIAIELQFVFGSELDLETAFLLNTSPQFEFAAYSAIALTTGEGKYNYLGEEINLSVSTNNANQNVTIDKVFVSFSGSTKPTKSPKTSTKAPYKDNGELQKTIDEMWKVDQERPTSAQVEMNWGTHISGKTGQKNDPLFKKVDEALFTKKQYNALITTYKQNLLTPDVCKAEPAMTGFRKQYFKDVFDAFTATPMFQSAFKYLQSLNIHGTSSVDTFKSSVLWPLWFGTYTRCKGPLGSSGWEHVFSGEVKGRSVDGQHNWVRYYLQQKADQMVYKGYYSHDENLIGTFQYTWMGNLKPKGGFFTGTSPAFDFSVLSICALAHGNGAHCSFNVNGNHITVTSYIQECGDGSGKCLATAYPSG